jgi:hypothetical protein
MREHDVAVTYGIERLSIHSADIEEAHHLRCQLAEPTARMVRVLIGQGERILYAASNIYRGSMFTQEREITSYLRASDSGNQRANDDPARKAVRHRRRKEIGD